MGTSLPANKRLALCDNEDRISNLPDDVLGLILSFLTTKETVATSILSKRWEYAWTKTGDLYFTDKHEHSSINRGGSFVDFVNKVLHYHGGTSTIRKFYLSCHNNKNCTSICEWVRAVIVRNVQELTFDCNFSMYCLLPWEFTCKTLVVLKIKGRVVLDTPTGFCLPSLNTLYLDGVLYRDESAKRLFSCCPVLESLDIRRNNAWDSAGVMRFSSISLKRLLLHCDVIPVPHRMFKAVIDCPSLEFFELHASFYVKCSMIMSSSNVEAHLHCSEVSGLLNGISRVEHLVLSSEAILSLDRFAMNHDLPTFPNLKEIELYVGEYIIWDALPNLLASSPKLEVLRFPEGLVPIYQSRRSYNMRSFNVNWGETALGGSPVFPHLKSVEINNFVGSPGEVTFVYDMLAYAEVLETMIIRCCDLGFRLTFKEKLKEQLDGLLRSPRASETCQLIISNPNS